MQLPSFVRAVLIELSWTSSPVPDISLQCLHVSEGLVSSAFGRDRDCGLGPGLP